MVPIKIDDYPAIKKHLDLYWNELQKRYDKGDTPYNLRNCAYMEDFSKQKIIWKRIGSILRFSYVEDNMMALDSTCFATGKHLKYLTALLNSDLGKYLMKHSPKTGTGDLIISVQAIEPLLMVIPNEGNLVLINNLMDKIMVTNSENEVHSIDIQINNTIYQLYNLSPEEILFIEGIS